VRVGVVVEEHESHQLDARIVSRFLAHRTQRDWRGIEGRQP